MYLTALIYLCIVYSFNSAAVEMDAQGTCGCCPGVPGIPGNNGASGPVGPKGDIGIKGSNGLKGEKGNVGFPGNVGPVGLQGVPGEVGLQGATGEKGEKGEKNEINKSAFFVVFTSDPGRVPSNVPTKYDTVITNIGGHYNKETGKFVCQYPGTYVFNFATYKDDDGSAQTKLMRNGSVVTTASSTSSGYNSVSNMAVIDLVADDEVWTEPTNWNYYWSSSWKHCTFSGFLLYPA